MPRNFSLTEPITFDLPLEMSTIEVPTDDFGLAEIASGFNKKTLISPLHATLLAAVAVNSGEMPIPWLVETIQDDVGNIVYNADPGVPILCGKQPNCGGFEGFDAGCRPLRDQPKGLSQAAP